MTVRDSAFTAAGLAQNMAIKLLASQSKAAPVEERLAYMAEAFFIWAYLAEEMSALERFAPRSAEAGYGDKAQLAERVEAFKARHGFTSNQPAGAAA